MKPARLLAGAVLLLLCALQMLALLRAPAAWMPAQITVALAPDADIVLGRDLLAAPGAAERALRLRRDGAGAWWAASPEDAPPLRVLRGERQARSGSILLAPGQRFQLGAAAFAAEPPEGGAGARITLTDADADAGARARARWRFDGATLTRDGAAQPDCPDAHLGVRLAALWNRVMPLALTLARPLVFGGNLDCGNRIGIAGLPAPAARIARTSEGLLLSSSDTPLLMQAGPEDAPSLLAQREQSLDGAGGLVLGRTRYALRRAGAALALLPVSHVALYAAPDRGRLPPGLEWTWTRRALWNLPPQAPPVFAGAVALALAWAAWGLARLQRTRRRQPREIVHALGGALLLGAGLTLLALQRSGDPAGAGIGLLAAWGALWFALLAPRRLPGVLGAGLLLLAVGLLAQLELGLGATESSWLRAFERSSAVLAIAAGAAPLLRLLRPARPPSQARVELGLLLLAGVALAGLLLEVVFGDETGVFDLQPVEFAKLALSALAAHSLALAGAAPGQGGGGALRRWLRVGAPALLFLVLLAVALVQVDDYSPLVLLAVWGGALALAHAWATRQPLLGAGLIGAALLGVAGVAFLRSAGAGEVAQWNFYTDRFLVWLDPLTHPHTGQQLLLGARAIAAGDWRGADGMFGLLSLGQDAGPALRVPAVQDDFAASFFLERHGLAAALGLWLLQSLFLALLARTALRCWLQASNARDFRLAWLARLRCFLLVGCAAFAFGHFLLSWGTNLAIFPVMGQPMSFLSAGGSHLLFFICPLLGLAAASSQSLEENEHAGLRPT
ncbi:FtsW/RodA/SpoVE family cell cycle protein [Massilia sp. 9096]|uniref:FtsW/RodA/SpoVE family cell cycle protein n=1 Tax=Massilia sp. 9096 TaxID=1500894 RepID=UPI00056C003B|nr:FtsW/RodA/SpoVE family cell cycle protein [Massilia sp. 9096]